MVEDPGADAFPVPASEPDDVGAADGSRSDRLGSLLLAGYIVAVVAGTAAAVALTSTGEHVDGRDVAVLVTLLVVASVYDVVARRVERVRRLTTVGAYFTVNSVWTFCGALVLPVWLTAVLVVMLFVQDGVQVRLSGDARPWYRVAFNAAAVLLPCLVVHRLVDWPRLLDHEAHAGIELPLVLAASLVLYAVVNAAVVAGVLAFAQRSVAALRSGLGTFADNLLEAATLALGGLLALAVWRSLWLIVLVLPILVLLQRIALVDHLESAASSDGKTGLLNAVAWTHLAERELVRTGAQDKPASVMIIDLDHFKQVNDVYGHLSGDAVLKAVADCMATVLRDRDLLSRFGGEEFVALLPDADAHEVLPVAERLRKRIADVVVEHRGDPAESVTSVGGEVFGAVGSPEQIRVTVSIGLASFPDQGSDLTTLLAKADAALYQAKRSGRNRVHTSA